ncbi:AGE family epimerase/isomerase [Salinicola aestuarinus]|uniref:AGE family epimerase/isomerase n=1 Tax=Salinicola aestuarinus TaxID=1949082 RepID=UPI001300A006|nr:AGE family epimerase/isomerase [Salinicola aestuarinus]
MPMTSSREIAHQIDRIVQFYHPRCIDTHSGFYHYFTDDGQTYNPLRRHLLSSAGFVSLYADEARRSGSGEALGWTRHGLRYLASAHFETRTRDYAWMLDHGEPVSKTHRATGLAAVLGAYAAAAKAGIEEAVAMLKLELSRLQTRYFDGSQCLYVDETDGLGQWTLRRSARTQHDVLKALMAAFEVTRDPALLERALAVTTVVWQRLAPAGDGWLWPHYDAEWHPDFEFHRDEIDDRLQPWGFQIGEQMAWARLLATLFSHFPGKGWLLECSQRLFTESMAAGWDARNGGLIQSVNFDRTPLVRDKLSWVQAEGLAAAAELQALTNEARFGRALDRLMSTVWQHFIDHTHGGWYDRLTPDNRRYSREKSRPPKVDQAPLEALFALSVLAERRESGDTRIARV